VIVDNLQILKGRALPAIKLASTNGQQINLADVSGRTVCFFYPYTGKPGVPDPDGWDAIVGAHGSTPQALAFSEHYSEFVKLGVSVFGISLQDNDWQRDFVERNHLAFPLLSDCNGHVSAALGLPLLNAGRRTFLKRTTLIVENGLIAHVRENVVPTDDATDCLAWLKA
jgi:peroxiredoxin